MKQKVESTRKKTILMIDNEPLMIDRRIVLEAQTLIDAGYNVVLATRGDSEQPHQSFERGMEVRRFPIHLPSYATTYERDLQSIIDWRAYPEDIKLERKIRKKLSMFPRYLQSIVYALIVPPVFASVLSRRFPMLKRLAGHAFDPLCFMLLVRPKYFMPYVRVARRRMKFKWQQKTNGSDVQQDLFSTQILKYTKELKPDFVHAHDLPNLRLGLEVAKQHLVPVVYDAHELYPQQYFSDKTHKSKFAELERQLIGNTDAVIAVNKQCEEVLRQTYTELSDVVILSNATEMPKDFDPTKKERLWHQEFNLDPAVKLMVFQGGINPVRNIDSLVRAMTQIPDNIHVGFITFKKDIAYYKELSAQLGIEHRIHYVLEIPWDEVIHWLAAADVGMMPYQANNLNAKISSPNKLFEFVVAGLPIIGSSDLVNVKEAVDRYGLGVCRPLGDDATYVDAIQAMFDETQGGVERFIPNVLAVRHLFSWDNEAPRLLDLYTRLDSGIK